jgi:hypothetical protein
LAGRINGLQLGAEQFTGVGSDVFDLQPLRFNLLFIGVVLVVGLFFLVFVVEGQPAEQQVGEQVGAALLVGAWILRTQAAGEAGEHAVDSGGISGGDFAGDIADAVDALHHGDSAVGEGAAVPFGRRQRFEPDHQPQQPHL